MRGRAWRRHIEEKVVIKRLRRQTSGQKYWSWIIDANRNYYKKTIVIDYLQSVEYYIAKTMTTKPWDSKHKVKYSPNKNKPYYRDGSKKFSTREMDKNLFVKILKENGIK
jgi:hypothetical protein